MNLSRSFLVLAAVLLASLPGLARQADAPAGRPDLSGRWDDAGRNVVITDDGNTIRAVYDGTKECKYDGTVSPYQTGFTVSGTGFTLEGPGVICYYGETDPENPTPKGVREAPVTITVSPDGSTLDGTQEGYFGTITFSLTRKCDPKADRLCQSLAAAEREVTGAIGSSQPSTTATFAATAARLAPLLASARAHLCDDPEGLEALSRLESRIETLGDPGTSNYDNNMALAGAERLLKDLASGRCGAASPPVCKPGEEKLSDGSAEAKDQVVEGLKEALKEADEKLRLNPRSEGLRQRINQYKKMIGVWENVQAASCVPGDVLQSLEEIRQRREGACVDLCHSTFNWMKAMGATSDPARTAFMLACTQACDAGLD